MKLSNKECLGVMRRAMEQIVIPDLKSRDAQASAQIVLMGFEELLKRESRTPDILNGLIKSGLEIAGEASSLLKKIESRDHATFASNLSDVTETACDEGNLAGLEKKYNALTICLEQGCKLLVAARRNSSEFEKPISDCLLKVASWELDYYEQQGKSLDKSTHVDAGAADVLRAEPLERFLQSKIYDRGRIQVKDLTRIPGGFGKETWFFILLANGREESLVVRKSFPEAVLDKGSYDLRNEFSIVNTLYKAGACVPQPRWFGHKQSDINGMFYVCERVAGKPVGTYLGVDEKLPESLWLDLAEKAAYLHSIPIATFTDYITEFEDPALLKATTAESVRYYVQWLYDWWLTFDRMTSPAEVYLFDWLFNHIPNNKRPPSFVHADFGVHNLMRDEEKITAILDWESAIVGDPAMDLAYLRKYVVGQINWRSFVDRYYAKGGPEIDESSFAFYDALLNTRNTIFANKSATPIKRSDSANIQDFLLALKFLPEMMRVSISNTLEG